MRKSLMSIGSAALALLMFGTSISAVEAAPLRVQQPISAQSDVTQVRNPFEDFNGRDTRRWRRGHHRDWRGNYDRYDRPYYNGHRGYRSWRHGYRRHNGFWYPGAAFAAGALIGGAVAAQPRYRVRSMSSAHVDYCLQRYRSYRVSDNTYQPNYGPRRRCVSPY